MLASSREPRAAARPAGGINPSPTTNGGSAANRGAAPFAISQTSVGDDACIVLQPPHSRKARGRAMALPYKPSEQDRPNRDSRNHPDGRRAGCLHPAGPCGGASRKKQSNGLFFRAWVAWVAGPYQPFLRLPIAVVKLCSSCMLPQYMIQAMIKREGLRFLYPQALSQVYGIRYVLSSAGWFSKNMMS